MAEIKDVSLVRVSELIPYINNAKQHSEDQITRIASSIREFGFLTPVLIDVDKNIIAGHGRIMAANKLNLEEVPCVNIEGLSEAQRKAYIIADNRLSEFSSWDMELVNGQLAELGEFDFDIDLTGFELPSPDEFGEDFELKDGDREPTITMSITFSDDEAEIVNEAIREMKHTQKYSDYDNPLNHNSNGNALFLVVEEWLQQRM